MGIGYAETQAYLAHFRAQGCDSQIVDNTEGIFNLCFYVIGELHQLGEELKKKQVNIVRLKQLVFGLRGSADEPIDEPDAVDSTAASNSQPEENLTPASQTDPTSGDTSSAKSENDLEESPSGDRKKKNNSKPKPKGHGRYGIDAYTGAQIVEQNKPLTVIMDEFDGCALAITKHEHCPRHRILGKHNTATLSQTINAESEIYGGHRNKNRRLWT